MFGNKKKKKRKETHPHLSSLPDGIVWICAARQAVGGANLEVAYGFSVAEQEDTAKRCH